MRPPGVAPPSPPPPSLPPRPDPSRASAGLTAFISPSAATGPPGERPFEHLADLWTPEGPAWSRWAQRAAVVLCGLGLVVTGTLLMMALADSLLFDNADFGVHSPTWWLTVFFALVDSWLPLVTLAGALTLGGSAMAILGRGSVRGRGLVILLACLFNPAVLLGLWTLMTESWIPRAQIQATDVITLTTEQDGVARTVTVGPDRFTERRLDLASGEQTRTEYRLDAPRRSFIQGPAERLLAPLATHAAGSPFSCAPVPYAEWTSWSVAVSGSTELHLSSDQCLPGGQSDSDVEVHWVWAIADRVDSATRAPLPPPD